MAEATQVEIELLKVRIEVIKEIGLLGYKFLITLNSGAFIVLLTFLGNIQGSNAFAMDLTSLKVAMWFFLAAIAGTFISMTIAYLSAQASLQGVALPGGKGAKGHMAWLLVPVMVSFVFFCLGGYFAIGGISAT